MNKLKTVKRLHEIKETLLIIDVNNGFTREGVFKNLYGEKIIPEVNRLARTFHDDKEKDILILNDCHDSNSEEFKIFPPHCIRGTSEADIVTELQWLEDYYPVFEKDSTCINIKSRIDLQRYYEMRPMLQRIYVCGLVTDICILENAKDHNEYFKELRRQMEILVCKNAIDTFDAPNHNRNQINIASFKEMEQAGIRVLSRYKERR